ANEIDDHRALPRIGGVSAQAASDALDALQPPAVRGEEDDGAHGADVDALGDAVAGDQAVEPPPGEIDEVLAVVVRVVSVEVRPLAVDDLQHRIPVLALRYEDQAALKDVR